MTAALAMTFGPDLRQPWSRLLVACSLSLLLHLALLAGIPVNPTGGVPNLVSTIYARLEPAASETPAESEPPVAQSALLPADKMPSPANEEVQPKPPAPDTRTETKSAAAASSPSAGLNMPLIRDPTYYPANQLDVYPQPLAPIQLNYPDSAAAARVDGRLSVLLLIDEFGVVNEASIVEARPAGYFEEATLAIFRAARFSPAKKQGHAVKSRVLLQVKYLYGDSAGAAR